MQFHNRFTHLYLHCNKTITSELVIIKEKTITSEMVIRKETNSMLFQFSS